MPLLRAPWGESVRTDTLTLFGRTLYNPYTVREGNSGRLASWQFERLRMEHFGAPIARTAFETMINRDLPLPIAQRWPVQVLVAALVFAYAAMGLWAYECSRSHRSSRSPVAVARGGPLTRCFAAAGIPFAISFRTSFARGGSLVTSLLEVWL